MDLKQEPISVPQKVEEKEEKLIETEELPTITIDFDSKNSEEDKKIEKE